MILNENINNTYVANGVTTSFPFTFKIFNKTEIVVTVIDIAGGLTTAVLNTDYTIPDTSVDNDDGGTVEFVTAPTNGYTISLDPVIELVQETDIRNQTGFLPEVIEDQFDRLVRADQIIDSKYNRTLRAPFGDVASLELPTADVRANKFLAFDEDGNIMATESVGFVQYNNINSVTATGGQTVVNFPTLYYANNGVDLSVFLNGVRLVAGSDYTETSATSITMTSALSAGDQIVAIGGSDINSLTAFTTAIFHANPDGTVHTVKQILNSYVITAKEYGAKGDGITDDTVALQTYINTVIAGNGIAIIPAGTYKITTALSISAPNGLIIQGSGGKTTFLTGNANGAFIIGDGSVEQRHITLRDFKIRSSGVNTNPAILANAIVRSRFDNIVISAQEDGAINYFNTAIDLRGVDYVVINNCNIRATAYGIQARSKNDGSYAAGLFITGGTKIAETTTGTGVRVHGGLGGVVFGECDILNHQNGVTFENSIGFTNREIFFTPSCTIDTCSNYGIVVNDACVTHVLVTSTWFGTCLGGIYWDDATALLSVNGARIVNTLAGGYGIRIMRTGANVHINDCRINGAGAADTAIDVIGVPSSLTIANNKIQTYTYGIRLPATATFFMVSGNEISGVTPIANVIVSGTVPDGLNKIIKDNLGYPTHNSGQVAMTIGTSSLVVNHGLPMAPQSVIVCPGADPGSRFYVGSFTGTTFTIYLTSPAPSAIPWQWQAQLYTGA